MGTINVYSHVESGLILCHCFHFGLRLVVLQRTLNALFVLTRRKFTV
jgi:hypothetical protein